MDINNSNIKSYLKRISYQGEIKISKEVLFVLQETHLKHIPFENLDIHNKIQIDFHNPYDKIVVRRRGGFCYELNFLFYQLLKKLGFDVKIISARVFSTEKGFGPEYDHMAIIARVEDEEYLMDVGFGEFSLHPLKMEPGIEIQDPRGIFRIQPLENDYLVVEKKNTSGVFIPEYSFTLNKRKLEEFYDMFIFHQTSSQSHFTQKRLCSLLTAEGRITLTGNILKITEGTKLRETEIPESEIEGVLKEYFQILIV